MWLGKGFVRVCGVFLLRLRLRWLETHIHLYIQTHPPGYKQSQQQLEQARKEVLDRVEDKMRREEIKDAVRLVWYSMDACCDVISLQRALPVCCLGLGLRMLGPTIIPPTRLRQVLLFCFHICLGHQIQYRSATGAGRGIIAAGTTPAMPTVGAGAGTAAGRITCSPGRTAPLGARWSTGLYARCRRCVAGCVPCVLARRSGAHCDLN